MAAAAAVPAGILLGLGNPLLDISSTVDEAFLKKYQLQPANAILCDEKVHLPIYAELAARKDVEYTAGGAAQNTIRVAQWMLQSAGATGYTGCIGKDEFGKTLTAASKADGVTTHFLQDEKVPTGTCAVCVVAKDRSLVANLSAANHFKLEYLQSAAMAPVLSAAKYFYIEGYFLTSGFSSIMHIAQHAHANDKIFALNLSAPFLSQFFSTQQLEALPYVDYLFGNESEAVAFGTKQGYADLSIPAIALKIAAHDKKNAKRARVVVITQGAQATVVASEGKVNTYDVPKLDAKLIVDTNGAGDAFCGGFMAKLVTGKPMADCCQAGHYAARQILQVGGAVIPKTKPEL